MIRIRGDRGESFGGIGFVSFSPMTERRPPTKLVPAAADHRDFVRQLSAEAFSRFGEYDKTLPELMDLPWIRTVVAEVEGAAIGFAMYSLEGIASGDIDLVAVAVIPSWRSRGVGRALLEHVEKAARSLAPEEAAGVHLTVAEDNARARKLFEGSGYIAIPYEHGMYPGGQRSVGLRKRLR